ncbi:hypothetical protein ACFE04_029799 [Oxalis oulophora]
MANPQTVHHMKMISNPCIHGDFGSSNSERKSRFMKWLSKLFKGGGSPRSSGGSSVAGNRNPQFLGDENTVWRAPTSRSLGDRSRSQREEENRFNLSDTLSQTEGLKRPNNGYKWKTDQNDEDLARALQDSMNSAACPPYAPPHYDPWENHRYDRTCGGCHRSIGSGNYLGCMGTFFHPDCFRCRSCGHPITEREFSLAENVPYHKSCFKELTHPKCEIPTNGNGLIEYRCHPFWTQKYCPSHEHDNTARCCSCERLESWNARFYLLEDGRSLCLECMESAIMDTGDCQPLYHSIRDYYEGMIMRIDQQIPMLLVQRQALNEAIVGEKNGYHHMPETRGLCLSEEQTVTTISKKPRLGGHRLVGMRTHTQKLHRKCEVTAILVLYGLPRLLTGAILAHELMHGWLRLNGYRNLSPAVEEGICQVLSYLWLESEVLPGSKTNMPSTSHASSSSSLSTSVCSKKGGKSGVEQKLGEFFMHQIAHDASPAYGEGFRLANAAVNKYGLRRTLDHIRYTGIFPVV